MFGIGTPEILIIIVVALLIFGPTKLPELGKTLGKGLREFKKASSDLKDQINPLNDGEQPQPESPNLISGEKTAGKKKRQAKRKPAKASKIRSKKPEPAQGAAKTIPAKRSKTKSDKQKPR
jgi:TatA/E family protein of Tat protein translocase